ncbi:GTP cyclohydrolase II [Stella humosa]|uniref:GTP cyclohydrolase-2 n=1 Tax=Stella humosa TaxID=94 RepID=A0A3N1LI93_9PROT|nr:GTP cyclohydrolase II [Stella humosa]ROP90934.1 GTP cyclohydrolase II [Stella humosa]BBK34716.1 GTP cyclohydrolase-2 [Stella humosa]
MPLSRVRLSDIAAAHRGTGGIAVDRATADFRRGEPLVVRDGDRAVLALAVEALSDERLARFVRLAGSSPSLAMTSRRASLLGLGSDGPGVVRVSLSGTPVAQRLRDLADPLSAPAIAPTVVAVTAARPLDADSAAVALAKIARLLPAAVTATIGLIDSRQVEDWARLEGLLIVEAAAILDYPVDTARRLAKVGEARVPLAGAENTRIIAFRPSDGGLEHIAIVIGTPDPSEPILARIHSECFTGDLLASLRCDCGDQLRGAIREIAQRGAGVLLYLAQEGRGIGLVNKLRAYQLQDEGFDTVDANLQLGFDADERIYVPAAEMLRQIGFDRVRLMTNNPLKVEALGHCGIAVVERVAHIFPSNDHNENYLRTKAVKSGHML